jgi:hypothetical protein
VGKLDEVRVYNFAFTAQEVFTDMVTRTRLNTTLATSGQVCALSPSPTRLCKGGSGDSGQLIRPVRTSVENWLSASISRKHEHARFLPGRSGTRTGR